MRVRALLLFALITVACALNGCAIVKGPIADPPRRAFLPRAGELTASAKRDRAAGGVEPIYILIANGTSTTYRLLPDQIFAVELDNSRIRPIPPAEAARLMSRTAQLEGALLGFLFGGVLVGMPAFAAPVAFGWMGATMGGLGALNGGRYGQLEAETQGHSQLTAVALRAGTLYQGTTAAGFVYFPKRAYSKLEARLVKTGDRGVEVIAIPLSGAVTVPGQP